jgi:23S rRNA (cytosine1962-C5)-methyltransferase
MAHFCCVEINRLNCEIVVNHDMKNITLRKGKDVSVLRGHPWVFSGAIEKQDCSDGEWVRVLSAGGNELGCGIYSANTSIAVRMMSFVVESDPREVVRSHIKEAFLRRKKLGILRHADYNMFRLIHAEGDGLPGLIVDVYGDTAVIQSHTSGVFAMEQWMAEGIVEFSEGQISRVFSRGSDKVHGSSVRTESRYVVGKAPQDAVFKEYGVMYEVDWVRGQKTGFFLDQRENRKLLGSLSSGKHVLNTFSYSGGFSLSALAGGAASAVSLDSSKSALDLALKNAEINGFSARHEVICADALDYLKEIPREYDIIVLDPPAFAKSLSARHRAVQGYMRINEAALRQLKPGGLLFTFSCSQVIDKKLFTDSVLAASISAGVRANILYQLHQPPDHPVSIRHPEGEYLKGLVLQITS